MHTNDLKKGTSVRLRNGWSATIEDNKKGNIRLCKVYGRYTELGSVYSHDIMEYIAEDGALKPIVHTEKQLKHYALVSKIFEEVL